MLFNIIKVTVKRYGCIPAGNNEGYGAISFPQGKTKTMNVRTSLIACAIIAGLSSTATAQSCDETWEVEKDALRQVFSDMPRYTGGSGPTVINLQALGAKSGQLVIVYSKKDLECAKRLYEGQLAGSGMIKICKRPRC